MKLGNGLIQTLLTTTETKRDIWYDKLGIQDASQVAGKHKTYDLRKSKNIRKLLSLGAEIAKSQAPYHKLNIGNSSEKICKSRSQTFHLISGFTGFLYFVRNILPRLV